MSVPQVVPDIGLREELILPVLIRSRAQETPDFVVVRQTDGGSRTYAELDAACRTWAAFFHGLGIRRGEIVATFLPASIGAIEVWMGLAWVGAVEAALNREYRQQMLVDVLNDTTATVVVTTRDHLRMLADVGSQLASVQRVVLVDGTADAAVPGDWSVELIDASRVPAEGAVLEPERLPQLHEPSCILYTSGTTGPSKGVVLPWAQMFDNGRYIVPVEQMSSSDVFYSPYQPCHITGKAYFYSMVLLGGGYVVKPRFRTSEFWPDVQKFGVTTTLLQGAMAHFLLRQEVTEAEIDNPLRQVVVAPVIPEVDELEKRFDVRVGTVYNMTEISCPLMSQGWYHEGPGSCCTPRPGVEARVVDEFDNEVPDGEVGELVIRHSEPWTLTSGYLNRPDATAEAFRNLWFHTGDAFYRTADGSFFFVDRMKDSIRRRGENISSAEVEREVRAFPGVHECAAVAHPSEFGEDDVRVFVVPKPDVDFDPAALHAFLHGRMARYMLPDYIDVVDDIPKTETQKIRKSELRKRPVGEGTWRAPSTRRTG